MTMTQTEAAETWSGVSWPKSWGPAPRYATARTPERETFGPQIRRIAKLLGLKRLPMQEYVWDVALEVQSEEAGDPTPGHWAYDTVDLTLPRRGSKTVTFQPVVMHRAELIKRASIAMTAQTGNAAAKRWRDLANIIEDSYLGDRVRKRDSPGHERLTWLETKATLEPFSPKADANHGDDHDLVGADEIWKLTAEQGHALDQAVRPMMLTNNLQLWRFSTAGTTAAAYYNAMRRQGRETVKSGRNLGRFYLECSVPELVNGVKVEELSDEALLDVIVAHHPRSYDLPDLRRFLAEELETAQQPEGEGRDGFLRAYGNHTVLDVSRIPLVAAPVMARGLVPSAGIPVGSDIPVGLAFDLDPEKRRGAISAVWRDDAGVARSTVIKSGPGTTWVAGEAIGILERGLNLYPHIAVNDTTVTRDVADQIHSAGFELLKVNSIDYAGACNRWYDETTAVDAKRKPKPTFLHEGHPQYLESVNAAGWRDAGRGGGRVFAVRDEPIVELTSAALALWAFDHLPEPEYDPGPFKIR